MLPGDLETASLGDPFDRIEVTGMAETQYRSVYETGALVCLQAKALSQRRVTLASYSVSGMAVLGGGTLTHSP